MKKISILLLLLGFLISCGGKENYFKVIEETFKDGSPHLIKYYKSKDKKILLKETIYYRSGKKKLEGSYNNTQKSGVWKAWFPNGNLWSQATYINGIENGEKTVYYENGNKYYQGFLKDNKRTGDWSFWDKEGKLLKTVTY